MSSKTPFVLFCRLFLLKDGLDGLKYNVLHKKGPFFVHCQSITLSPEWNQRDIAETRENKEGSSKPGMSVDDGRL